MPEAQFIPPTCQVCEKPLVDNRATRTGNQPLWKCPDRSCAGKPIFAPREGYDGPVCKCGGAMWVKREGQRGPYAKCRYKPGWDAEAKKEVGGGCRNLLWDKPESPRPVVGKHFDGEGVVKRQQDAFERGEAGPLGAPPVVEDLPW